MSKSPATAVSGPQNALTCVQYIQYYLPDTSIQNLLVYPVRHACSQSDVQILPLDPIVYLSMH